MILVGLLLVAGTAMAGPDRVVILPFAMNSQKDLTFLQGDIFDLLTSRLQWPGRVEVVGRQETTDAMAGTETPGNNLGMARAVGRRLGARFVLCGSLTLFGDSLSLDIQIIDLSSQSPALALHQVSRGPSRVISGINGFATRINRTLFGRQ